MLSLRPVQEGDRDRMRAWRNQPDVARWMYTDHEITAEEHQRWFDALLGDPDRRYWIIGWEGTPAGVVHLTDLSARHRRAEWGIYLAEPAVRGTGAAAGATFLSLDHAFGRLGLARVTCEALGTNDAALRLYERMGFRREGTRRAHIVKADGVHDVVCLGILAAEWAALRPALHAGLVERGVLGSTSG